MSRPSVYERIENFSKIVYQCCGFNQVPIVSGNKKRSTEVYLRIWALFLFGCVLTGAAFAVKYEDIVFNHSFVGKANDALKFSTVYVSFAVCIAESLANGKKLEKFYAAIQKFSNEIKISERRLSSYSREARANYGHIFLLMLAISIAMEVIMIACIGFSRQWKYFWLLNLVPILACRMRNLQYFHALSHIKLQIRIIKDELRQVVDFTNWNLNLNSRGVDEVVARLQDIKNAYGRSCEATNAINDFFSLSLAANIVHEYVQSACDYYWTYIRFLDDTRDEALGALILSASVPLAFLLFSLYHAEKAKFEASEIAPLLHSIRKRKGDVKLYKMINQFSLQIAQEEISFHASSIFTVNLSLFVSIINALVSYLVIFIQFSSVSQDRKKQCNQEEYPLSVENPFFHF